MSEGQTAHWTGGYTTHTLYTYGYYHEMNPTWLAFCLLSRGLAPLDTTAADFRYCELAFGQGVSANIHAVAHTGHFVGMDFLPDQALFATSMATTCGTGLVVSDDALADWAEQARQGQHHYDCICLHGGWTWISAASRAHVLDFVRHSLRPGGVFYMSYNVLPGWSVTAPLRELFRLFDGKYCPDGMPGEARIGQSLALTGEFLATKPLFLNASDWIAESFNQMKGMSPAWLDHEFFNDDWELMYFRDVARQLAQAKLRFAASAHVHENVRDFGLTPEVRAFLAHVADEDVYQQLRDFACNTRFRTDIFTRGSRPLSPQALAEAVRAMRFVLAKPAANPDLTLACGMGTFQLDAGTHGVLLDLLAAEDHRPKSGAELLEGMNANRPEPLDARSLCIILQHLAGKGYVWPCQNGDAARAVTDACHRCNATILADADLSAVLNVLASPQTGGGIVLSADEAKALRAGDMPQHLRGLDLL